MPVTRRNPSIDKPLHISTPVRVQGLSCGNADATRGMAA
jgi:hypothetical protein